MEIIIRAVMQLLKVKRPFDVGVKILLKYALVFLSFMVNVAVSNIEENIIIMVINPGSI